ncbi:hypothetical protein EI94DRAFT_1705970 [Lactarius quietus]|nr:hypothetical protein EI94DRAFT_1705970 [Lactarius quietus]
MSMIVTVWGLWASRSCELEDEMNLQPKLAIRKLEVYTQQYYLKQHGDEPGIWEILLVKRRAVENTILRQVSMGIRVVTPGVSLKVRSSVALQTISISGYSPNWYCTTDPGHADNVQAISVIFIRLGPLTFIILGVAMSAPLATVVN